MRINAIYRKTGPVDRNIEVLVSYQGEEPKEGRPRGKYPIINLIVQNSTTVGISSDELDTGTDRISIPPRKGKETKWMRIVRVINQNCGFMRLEVK